MNLKVGLVSTAHIHVYSYVHHFQKHPRTSVVGLWDDNAERGQAFAEKFAIKWFPTYAELLNEVNAVAICSENNFHLEHVRQACEAGKDVLCEKPVVARAEDFAPLKDAFETSGIKFMTAFPCRFSPAYAACKKRILAGEIGKLVAINATNRGRCPKNFATWFVEPALSGGGAMIDHVVHVSDLLKDLLGEEPDDVVAQIGNNMYEQEWDDTAMLTLTYPNGVFVTLDSSWSRPESFKTWGDVTMKFIGEKGVISLDMFNQAMDLYTSGNPTHSLQGYGSDLDGAMVDAFVKVCLDNDPIPVTLEDGLAATRVSLAGYASARERVTA